MSERMFVIGIDGGDFSLIKSWVKKGELPNLGKMMDQGSYGDLRSTIPPITGAAWSSFQTGTNPGKHGAYNWFKRKKDEYRATPVNSRDIAEPTLWEILGRFDKKSGVIGVPVTYPPSEINGFLLPGLLTPQNSEKQSYPADLIKEVREIEPDFKFSPKEWTRGYDPGDWVKEMESDIESKTEVTTNLMRKKSWNFMMVHYMETDQVQHFMWDSSKDRENNPVLNIYKKIDEAVGRIQEELDDKDTLLIMSDHGFGPLNYNFHIDTWLLQEGYMELRKNLGTRLKKSVFNLGFTKEALYPVGEYIYPILRKEGIMETVLDLASHPWLEKLFLSSQNVNWSRTKAYSHSEIGHIYLNVKGREPRGAIEPEDVPEVREELIEKLGQLKNPYTGKKITSQIYKGEEIYSGDKAGGAPDIVFLPDDMEILGKGAYDFLSHSIVSKCESQTGHHRMDGIFLATGPGIEAGKAIEESHIMDLAPTILYKMDLPVLDHMDGEVIKSIFSSDYLEENKIDTVSKKDLGLEKKDEDSDEGDEKEMKKRLKGLGYVS
ncbi:MAG: alkaline phosphatase family protein [Halanaerobiales bacterium]